MFVGFGIGGVRGFILQKSGKAGLGPAVVLSEFGGSKSFGLKARSGLHDVHVLRRAILPVGEELGIERELQNRRSLSAPGELRVDDFVAPRSQRARSLHALKHVRPAAPPPVSERALDDYRDAGVHCIVRVFERKIARQADRSWTGTPR